MHQTRLNSQIPPRSISSKKIRQLLLLSLIALTLPILLHSEPALAQATTNTNTFNPQAWLISSLEWIKNQGTIGGFVFILLYIIAAVAFLPGSVLTLGGGFVFGVFLGSLYVFVGASIGATAAFLIGRYIARGWVVKKISGNDKFAAIDRAVGREGLKIVLLTRLSPIFPFNLLNYAYGVTGVSLKDYILGTIGILPGTIMYVYLGSLASSLATLGSGNQTNNPTIQWTIRIIGFIATVAVTLYITKIARNALNQEVSPENDL